MKRTLKNIGNEVADGYVSQLCNKKSSATDEFEIAVVQLPDLKLRSQ